MINFDTSDETDETRNMLEVLDKYLMLHGYPDAIGLLIIPLMDDGFGVLGAIRGQKVMTMQQTFEYLEYCVDHLRSMR